MSPPMQTDPLGGRGYKAPFHLGSNIVPHASGAPAVLRQIDSTSSFGDSEFVTGDPEAIKLTSTRHPMNLLDDDGLSTLKKFRPSTQWRYLVPLLVITVCSLACFITDIVSITLDSWCEQTFGAGDLRSWGLAEVMDCQAGLCHTQAFNAFFDDCDSSCKKVMAGSYVTISLLCVCAVLALLCFISGIAHMFEYVDKRNHTLIKWNRLNRLQLVIFVLHIVGLVLYAGLTYNTIENDLDGRSSFGAAWGSAFLSFSFALVSLVTIKLATQPTRREKVIDWNILGGLMKVIVISAAVFICNTIAISQKGWILDGSVSVGLTLVEQCVEQTCTTRTYPDFFDSQFETTCGHSVPCQKVRGGGYTAIILISFACLISFVTFAMSSFFAIRYCGAKDKAEIKWNYLSKMFISGTVIDMIALILFSALTYSSVVHDMDAANASLGGGWVAAFLAFVFGCVGVISVTLSIQGVREGSLDWRSFGILFTAFFLSLAVLICDGIALSENTWTVSDTETSTHRFGLLFITSCLNNQDDVCDVRSIEDFFDENFPECNQKCSQVLAGGYTTTGLLSVATVFSFVAVFCSSQDLVRYFGFKNAYSIRWALLRVLMVMAFVSNLIGVILYSVLSFANLKNADVFGTEDVTFSGGWAACLLAIVFSCAAFVTALVQGKLERHQEISLLAEQITG